MNEFKESLKVSEEDLYKEHKRKRKERVYKKFGIRPKAHIDEEWQKEIIRDVIDEMRY